MKEQEICDLLKTYLDEERYTHTLGVRDCAVRLAGRYGVDIDKARLAGLLHDCAKMSVKGEYDEQDEEAGYELGRGIFQNEALMHWSCRSSCSKTGVWCPEILRY